MANLNHGQKKADVEISTTQTEAAQLLNVSRESVVSAKKVLDQGDQSLIQKANTEISVIAVSKPEAAAIHFKCFSWINAGDILVTFNLKRKKHLGFYSLSA